MGSTTKNDRAPMGQLRGLRTHLLTSDWDQLQHTVRYRVLQYFHRHGLLEPHVTDANWRTGDQPGTLARPAE